MKPSPLHTLPTQNILSILDWVIIIAYFGAVLWIGLRFTKRQTSTDHYFVADHKIPGWAVGMSMFATMLSSFTFIAYPGWAFDRDWQVLVREAMAPFVVIFCAILIIPVYRSAIRMSAYEYLEKRFGYIGRLYGTTGFLIVHFTKTGVVLFTLAVAIQAVTGLDQTLVILVMGVTTLAFTFLGGIEGVVWTEVIQGVLMLFGGLIVIGFLLFLTDHPFAAVTTAWNADKFRMINVQTNLGQEGFWLFVLVGLNHFITKYATDQTIVQRYLLAPSVKQAVKGTLIGLLCCIAAWTIFFAIGSMLWGFYQIYPERLGEGITKGDQIFPYFIGKELPAGLTGLVLAGLFAAAQSTIAGDLNCLGACVTSDFYMKLRPDASEKRRLWVAKLAVAITGVLMVLFALGMQLYPGGIAEFAMDLTAIIGSFLSSGLLALFLLGFFTRRVHTKGMYVGLVVSWIATGFSLFHKDDKVIHLAGFSFHFWLLPVVITLITMAAAYLASVMFSRTTLAPLELTVYGHRSTLPWHQSLRNLFRND